LNIPVYLEPGIAKVVREQARKSDARIAAVVNEWLRKTFGPEFERAS